MLAENNEYEMAKINAVPELQALIQQWIMENPSVRTPTKLSRESNVSDSCIRRILNDNSLPVWSNLYRLCTFIIPGTNKQMLTAVGKNIAIVLRRNMHFLEDERSASHLPLSKGIESKLDSFIVRTIYALAQMDSGLPISKATEMFGESADTAILYLIEEAGCFIKNERLFSSKNESTLSLTGEFVKSYLPELISNFYKAETPYNFSALLTEEVSKQGYGKIIDVLLEAQMEIRKIAAENKGDIPFFWGATLDTMSFKPVFNKDNGGQK